MDFITSIIYIIIISHRMSVESQEERTVEVSGFPEVVDEDLLSMYFTNKRRSGGGTLISLEVVGRRAVLVFEEVEGKNWLTYWQLVKLVMKVFQVSCLEYKEFRNHIFLCIQSASCPCFFFYHSRNKGFIQTTPCSA